MDIGKAALSITANDASKAHDGEAFSGTNGVRAYPQGEVSGSRVWLARLETRYHATAQVTPYLLYDHGRCEAYLDEPERVAGGGLGLRYSGAAWGLDAAVAFQTIGETTTENKQRDPRFWIQRTYRPR